MIYVVEYWWRKGGYNDDYKLKTGNILKEKYRKGESFKEFLKISNIRSGDTFTNQTLTWDHIWTKDRSSPSILKIPHCIIEMARTYIFILAKVFLNQGGTRDGKTCRYCRYICAIFSLAVLIFCLYTRKLAKDIVLLALC